MSLQACGSGGASKNSLSKRLVCVVQFAALLSAICSLAVVFGAKSCDNFLSWAWEIASNFPVQLIMIQGLALLTAVFYRCYRKLAVLWLVFIAINVSQIAPLYSAPDTVATVQTSASVDQPLVQKGITCLQMNLLYHNTAYKKAAEVVSQYQSDIVCFEEYSSDWDDNLSSALVDYPHKVAFPKYLNYGVAVYSKYPLEEAKEVILAPNSPPAIVAKVRCDGNLLCVVCVHTFAPFNTWFTTNRNSQMQAIAKFCEKSNLPTIVVGDLNCTPWSYQFKQMLEVGKLSNSQNGFGLQNSWQLCLGLSIPIDHILASGDISIKHREIGPEFDSDHRPVFVHLNINQ